MWAKKLVAFGAIFYLVVCYSVAGPVVGHHVAVQDSTAILQTRADSIRTAGQVDAFDVIRKIFRPKKGWSKVKNAQSNGPFIIAIPYPNYTISTGFAAALPVNISFYTNTREKGKLSFFNNVFQYTQFNQIIAFSLSNLYFKHEKWELIGDWRYYKFPTYTYGLGIKSRQTDQSKVNYSHFRFYEMVMRKVAKNVDVGIGYHLDQHWNIDDANADIGQNTDFRRYGFSKSSTSSALSLNFIYDGRDNNNNPSTGYYFNFQFRSNLKVIGSSSNWNSVIVDARKYVPLSTKWRTELAFWAYMSLTLNGNPPYLDLPSTGGDTYNNTGRGYAMGRFRGLSMLYFETEFRFDILRNGLLGGVTFFNLQNFTQWPYHHFGNFQPGGGLGLRIKLNKQTNTNSAFDYGFGTNGSRGFAFNLNEVF